MLPALEETLLSLLIRKKCIGSSPWKNAEVKIIGELFYIGEIARDLMLKIEEHSGIFEPSSVTRYLVDNGNDLVKPYNLKS